MAQKNHFHILFSVANIVLRLAKSAVLTGGQLFLSEKSLADALYQKVEVMGAAIFSCDFLVNPLFDDSDVLVMVTGDFVDGKGR